MSNLSWYSNIKAVFARCVQPVVQKRNLILLISRIHGKRERETRERESRDFCEKVAVSCGLSRREDHSRFFTCSRPILYFFSLLASIRQSYPDKHERFVCIVLRQRQHVSRTNGGGGGWRGREYFSLQSRVSSPGRDKNSSVWKFYLPLALTLLFSRESTRLPPPDHSTKPRKDEENETKTR